MRAAERRLTLIAVTVGLLTQGGLALVIYLGGHDFEPLAVLVLVIAVFLGFSFGARAGAIGAGAPWLLFVVEAVREGVDDDAETSLTAALLRVAFVAGFLAFIAWFCGMLRDRFMLGRR